MYFIKGVHKKSIKVVLHCEFEFVGRLRDRTQSAPSKPVTSLSKIPPLPLNPFSPASAELALDLESEGEMAGVVLVSNGCRGGAGGGGNEKRRSGEEEGGENQISLLALLLTAIRKSMVSCRMERTEDEVLPTAIEQMEIGWPTNVQHVAHVTFDRFHGFLGLPVEFELEIPCRVPSAR